MFSRRGCFSFFHRVSSIPDCIGLWMWPTSWTFIQKRCVCDECLRFIALKKPKQADSANCPSCRLNQISRYWITSVSETWLYRDFEHQLLRCKYENRKCERIISYMNLKTEILFVHPSLVINDCLINTQNCIHLLWWHLWDQDKQSQGLASLPSRHRCDIEISSSLLAGIFL